MYNFLDKIGLKSLLDFIKSKIPTKVSELQNDSGFVTTDTNTLPYQYNTTADGEYRLLLSYQANDNSYREDFLRKSGKFTANPSTGVLTATTFKGDLNGNAATVNGHKVEKDVPSNAVFTDTVYSLPTAGLNILGGVKTNSTITSSSGHTPCPIIGGIPYYKDTDTKYTLTSFGLTATAAELNYCDGVTSNIQTQLNSKAKTSDLDSYLPLSGGIMSGSIESSNSYPVVMTNANSSQYRFPIKATNSDGSVFMRMATSHTSNENGLLMQIFSPSGTMAALNIYSGTSGKKITTDCELPKNYVTGTFAISSSSTSATVTLGFKPSFVVLYGGGMQAYTGVAWITSTGFKTPVLSSVYSGTWTYIAFK